MPGGEGSEPIPANPTNQNTHIPTMNTATKNETSALIFEGAGWEKAPSSDVGNCRIRTRLVNDDGVTIYLEIHGCERTKYTARPFDFTGYASHCYAADCNESSEWKRLEGKPFSYTAAGLLAWVNENLRCSFTQLEVVNDGSAAVHETEGALCQSPKREIAFAVPGESSIIDTADPVTRLGHWSGENLAQVQIRYPGAQIVFMDEWIAAKAAEQNAPGEWQECTKDRHWEMLEVLPPRIQQGGAFLVGEPMDHNAGTGEARYQAHRELRGGFFVYSRPVTVREFRALIA